MSQITRTEKRQRARRRLAFGLALCLAAPLAVSHTLATAEPSTPLTLYVNSADFGGQDLNHGDGVCDAGGTVTLNGNTLPRCTMRAAVEEARAWTEGPGGGASVTITLDSDFPGGTITAPQAGDVGFMQAVRSLVRLDVWFSIATPMTIDLQNKLHTDSASEFHSAVFYITGEDVTIKNASGIISGDTALLLGASAYNVTIDGGKTIQTGRGLLQRFLVVTSGAIGVTLKNYQVGGLYSQNAYQGGVVFWDDGTGDVTRDVLIENVDFTSPQKTSGGAHSTTCTLLNASGCVNEAVTLADGAHVDNLEITGCTMSNATYRNPYDYPFFDAYHAGVLSNLNIHHNRFSNNIVNFGAGADSAIIVLPDDQPMGGVNTIANNVFDNSGVSGQPWAIGWDGALSGAKPSHLSITDNHFDGFARGGIILMNTGLVTVARNTFGPSNASASPDILEETANGSSSTPQAMLVNFRPNTGSPASANANEAITPWGPSAISMNASCQVSITAIPSNLPGAIAPSTPLQLDVFWTATTKAERYLGSSAMNITGTTGTVTVQIPADLVSQTGLVAGRVRLQVQTNGPAGAYAQTESSQYSRTIAIPAVNCTPPSLDGDLNVAKRAWLNADGLTHDQIIAPGHGGATEVASGSWLPSGTTIWWTYTLTYVYLDPITGLPSRTGQAGAKGVQVVDSDLGPICVIDVPINTPVGCVGAGQVSEQ